MKTLMRNPYVSWTIRVGLIVLAVSLIAGFAFIEGQLYANRRLTVRLANDLCYFSWTGLRALKDPVKNPRALGFFDSEMDSSAQKLAEMSLRYPALIKPSHYYLLLKVRDYRKQYGRETERPPNLVPAEVDRKVAQAISYLESIHDTNEWGELKLDDLIKRLPKP
jgi:hypothetical protein